MTEDTAPDAGARDMDPQIAKDRELIVSAKKKGFFATLAAYTKLSGPGWLQSAITLGGGSLSSSLYLGVLGGFALLWLQPMAMIIGIIMLSAIAYVTLSTGERPFRAINKHVNPVLGWGWLIATLLANCVWALPQFGLAFGSMSQNLLPSVFGAGAMDPYRAKMIISISIAVLCIIVVFCYDGGGKAVKFFDILLKLMVGVIVVSFFGVVVYMSYQGALDWSKIGNGLIPDLRMLWTPASTFDGILSAAGSFKDYWAATIVSEQQDVLIAAAATAVGINMTFLLPYSMLKKGWNKDFRGLAGFDLSTGLFIPFILATGCVVIASASQFHTKPAVPFAAEDTALAVCALPAAEQTPEKIQAIVAEAYQDCLAPKETKEENKKAMESFSRDAAAAVAAEIAKPPFAALDAPAKCKAIQATLADAGKGKLKAPDKKLLGGYRKNATARLKHELKGEFAKLTPAQVDQRIADLPLADRKLAAMLVRRDSIHLSQALAPLTGNVLADYVFGIGVVGMAISSIIILMLINGFCICEIADKPSKGWLYRFGCMMPAVGVLGPFIWSGAAPYLAIPTSVIGFIVIPIAYATFGLVLNQRKLLGDNMPRGIGRWIWNLFIFVGVVAVTIGSVYMAYKKTIGLPGMWGRGWVGPAGIGLFIGLAVLVHFVRKSKGKETL